MEHTQGQLITKAAGLIGPKNKTSIAQVFSGGTDKGDELAKANARRFVACWNACDGIPNEVLDSGGLGDYLEGG